MGSSIQGPPGGCVAMSAVVTLCQQQGKESLCRFKRSVLSAGRKTNQGWCIHVNTVLFMGGVQAVSHCASLLTHPLQEAIIQLWAQPEARGKAEQSCQKLRAPFGSLCTWIWVPNCSLGSSSYPAGNPPVILLVSGSAQCRSGKSIPTPHQVMSCGKGPCRQLLAGSRAGKPSHSSRE